MLNVKRLMYHVSHFTPNAQRLTFNVSRFTSNALCLTPYTYEFFRLGSFIILVYVDILFPVKHQL